jgi:ubiquinone/menaquinone biosynthesis C-methylase UbiE
MRRFIEMLSKKSIFINNNENQVAAAAAVKDYWTDHNVTSHKTFLSEDESLSYFKWRNDQYFKCIDYMPVTGFDGKVILDFGCGPGHDLVGFGVYSDPKKLIGIDVSARSLSEASDRLKIHGVTAELIQLDPNIANIPMDDMSVDHIHSSGVLHHTPDPLVWLQEMYRVLKPSGSINIMVYNYDSIWMHLYVAYQRSIVQGLYSDLSLREQFAKSTDGEDCPISNCYRPDEWIEISNNAGFEAEFIGAAISMHEASLANLRFAAIQDLRTPPESRQFLLDLEFDIHGLPIYNSFYAGVDACYRLYRKGNK